MKAKSPRRRLIVLLLICLVVVVSLEIYFRLSAASEQRELVESSSASFVFYGEAPFVFDRRHGFLPRPDTGYVTGLIVRGALVNCMEISSQQWPDYGPDDPSWQGADLRIAVFGGAQALLRPDNRAPSWPEHMEDALEDRTGSRVTVANFSRPHVGFVQNLLLASEISEEWQPHVIVLVLETDLFARMPVWRSLQWIHGTAVVVEATTPDVASDPVLGTVAPVVIASAATTQWCHSQMHVQSVGLDELARRDGVLRAMVGAYEVGRLGRHTSLVHGWMDFDTSFLVTYLMENSGAQDAQQEDSEPSPYRPRNWTFEQALSEVDLYLLMNALIDGGSEIVVLHAPLFPELDQGAFLPRYSGLDDPQFNSWIEGIRDLTDEGIVHLTRFSHDLPDPATVVNNPDGDWQLTPTGARLYGELAAAALIATIDDEASDQ